MAVTDGKIKTFPLRGIKDTPLPARRPPVDAGGQRRALNLVLGTRLTNADKQDLVAFLQAL